MGHHVILNPGSGPVGEANEVHAVASMAAFADDLTATGQPVDAFTRTPAGDMGDGRYAFTLQMRDGRTLEVQMPGLPTAQVRWLDQPEQNIWDFPRLYVDGSSWVWKYALSACEPDDES
ncbi:hypothetical protein ACWGI0_23120 [Streptomyces sp. NPDC054802]